jgi:hypothetical protein
MSFESKLTAPECHLTKKVNKAEQPTCVSMNIEQGFKSSHYCWQWDKESVKQLK